MVLEASFLINFRGIYITQTAPKVVENELVAYIGWIIFIHVIILINQSI